MFKKTFIYILLSIIVVVFAKYFHLLVLYIDTFFTYLSLTLAPIFSKSHLGLLIRQIMVLSLLPIAVVGLPALAYRSIKGSQMPYLYEAVWISWLVVVLSNILIR